ncbi:MAG: uracil-DNA glycosylase family protein [Prevotella sp.]|nr:uracil-DNA glycosylase family protein [Prevotella sp.]
MKEVERHPLQPFLPEHARMLMLGSFPPARRRWSMEFFYPNFHNDFWRVMGLCFFGDKDYLVDEENRTFRLPLIRSLLTSAGIAIYDTATEVIRQKNTASDKDLEVVTPTDLDSLLDSIPECTAIVATGEKSTGLICSYFDICEQPSVGESVTFVRRGRELRLYRMPSTSRAYPLKLEKKAEKYKAMFSFEKLKLGNENSFSRASRFVKAAGR